MYEFKEAFYIELEKIAYGSKEHKGLAQTMLPPTTGAGKSLRQAVGRGAVRVDTGITNPVKNIFTFSRAHAASNIPMAQFGKQVAFGQNEASKDLARAASALDKGILGSGDAKAQIFLGRSAGRLGRESHRLVDRSVHTDRPAGTGKASILRKSPIMMPGMGFLTSGIEHIKSDDPKGSLTKGVAKKIKGTAQKAYKGEEVDISDGHKLDKILGDRFDKRAIERSRRFGRVYKKKAIAHLMKTEGVSKQRATAMVERVMKLNIPENMIQQGMINSEIGTLAGEIKHRLKSPGRRMRKAKTAILRLLR